MKKLKMKNCNTIFIERPHKYQSYLQVGFLYIYIYIYIYIYVYIYVYIYTLHVKKVLPSYQRQIIEQTKFTYLPLGKSFGKQTKIIENKGNQQREAAKKQGAALNGA